MANELKDAVKVQNVEVVRHGEKLTLPQDLEIGEAIKLLKRRQEFEDSTTMIIGQFDVFPWDGSLAMFEVLKDKFGWSEHQGATIMVESGINETVSVPWGKFEIPGIDGVFQTDVHRTNSGRFQFELKGSVKRKHEHIVKELMEAISKKLLTSSIYRGKAISVAFVDDAGDPYPMPQPKFIDVSKTDERSVAYAKPVADAIETNLFTPIRRMRELEANGLKLQRSVLLGGVFGTGKTLAAAIAAKLAVENGMTYIYVAHSRDLKAAIEFGRQYQDPACMIFCEDIDRVLNGDNDRNEETDFLLNIVDGIDTKNDRRMLVFTTNALDKIEPAMLRPGRLDAVIEITPPDAAAAWKLVQIYGGDTLSNDMDATAIGHALQGQIPAVIAEVVKRAKLSQLKLTPVGHKVHNISTEAILDAAQTMVRQSALLNRTAPVPTKLDEAMAVVGAALQGVEDVAEDRDVIRITSQRARAAG